MATALTIWLNTQGQATAVGSIVNAGYGFICGAYMPFASYSPGLQKVCSYLPSTYATTVIRQHVMGSSIDLLKKAGLPTSALDSIKEGISFTVSFPGPAAFPPRLFSDHPSRASPPDRGRDVLGS